MRLLRPIVGDFSEVAGVTFVMRDDFLMTERLFVFGLSELQHRTSQGVPPAISEKSPTITHWYSAYSTTFTASFTASSFK